jgi:isoleucyl-tRNA synthetase
MAVASEKMVTVAIDTVVSEVLRLEGLGREVVRRIQALRKEAGFDIADRIAVYYQANGPLAQAFEEWREFIMTETLSRVLQEGPVPENAYQKTLDLDGENLTLALAKLPALSQDYNL